MEYKAKRFIFSNWENTSFVKLFSILIGIRVLLFLVPMNYGDVILNFNYNQFFLNGDLPYCSYNSPEYQALYSEFRFQLPLFYYFFFPLVWLSKGNIIVYAYLIKITFAFFDWGVMYLIFLIGKEMLDEKSGRLAMILYSFTPGSYFMISIFGMEESTTMFFALLTIFYFIKEKYGKSAFWMGIGFSMKILPAFYLIAFIPYFYRKKEIKTLIYYLIIFIFVYLLLSLPYIIICPDNFIYGQIHLFSRFPSVSLVPYESYDRINITLFTINIELLSEVLSFSIGLLTLFQLTIIVSLFFFFFFYRYSQQPTQTQLLKNILTIHLFLPLFTLSVHLRNFYWMAPYLIICLIRCRVWMFKNKPLHVYFNKMYIITIIFSIIAIIFHFALWYKYGPENKTINDQQYSFYLKFFALYLSVWSLLTRLSKFNKEFQNYLVGGNLFLWSSFIVGFFVEIAWWPSIYLLLAFVSLIIGIYFSLIPYYRKKKR